MATNPWEVQTTKVEYLLCDVKIVKCEELYANSMMGLKFFQALLTKLVKQLIYMKVGSSPYFQPLPISMPPSSCCIKSLNVETCLVCNEDFDFNDICVTSYNHTLTTLKVY